MYGKRANDLGAIARDIDAFLVESLFTIITFDPERLQQLINKAGDIKREARKLYLEASIRASKDGEELGGPANWEPAEKIGL